jgi:two-component system response regulator DevR
MEVNAIMDIIKIMLVEDDPFWQKHLAEDLNAEADLKVVVTVSNKEKAIESINKTSVDVVLLDINLTEANLDGLELAKEIKRVSAAKVIMLTSLEEKDIIVEAFCQGADNFIYKSSYKDIVSAVRAAYQNRISIHSDVSQILTKELVKERKLRILTPTERELYDLQLKGMSKSQIANSLFKSVSTVKNQIRKIKEKLTSTLD